MNTITLTILFIISVFLPITHSAPVVMSGMGGGDPALASGAGAAFFIATSNGHEVAFAVPRRSDTGACGSNPVELVKAGQNFCDSKPFNIPGVADGIVLKGCGGPFWAEAGKSHFACQWFNPAANHLSCSVVPSYSCVVDRAL